jgi:hypothetical protein
MLKVFTLISLISTIFWFSYGLVENTVGSIPFYNDIMVTLYTITGILGLILLIVDLNNEK